MSRQRAVAKLRQEVANLALRVDLFQALRPRLDEEIVERVADLEEVVAMLLEEPAVDAEARVSVGCPSC